jgi:hypothetical protein
MNGLLCIPRIFGNNDAVVLSAYVSHRPTDLVNHAIYGGSCANRRHLIELPRAKSQVEKRSCMLYQVTINGIVGQRDPDSAQLTGKERGVVCACGE